MEPRESLTTTAQPIGLTTDIMDVPSVAKSKGAAFRKLGIRCVADLILHIPHRYELELGEQTIASLYDSLYEQREKTHNAAVSGEVAAVQYRRGQGKSRMEATLEDGTGTIQLIWFNAPWMRGKLHPGDPIRVSGQMRWRGDYLQMINARWTDAEDTPEQEGTRDDRLRPVYPASEQLTSEEIERAVQAILEPALAQIDDHLHDAYRRERAMVSLVDAYRAIHQPESEQAAANARRRLALDELLLFQIAVMLKRHQRRDHIAAPALMYSDAIDEHIRARFPFSLTDAQNEVLSDIVKDISTTTPMNRLLQGDVGAGKTVVALYGMLMAVASNTQAALLAPTSILAEQHYASIQSMLEGSHVSIEVLTGATPRADRARLLQHLEDGSVDMLIGTHALLTESVLFKDLGVVVIDEQHRFGVHQRAVLRSRGTNDRTMPHTLVMTATPIPRTLSLTVFGDLDISTIRGLPPGRQPITTRMVNLAQRDIVYDYIAGRIRSGEQAYIVVPVIDESERGLRDLKTHMEYLSKGPLRGLTLAEIHGRMRRDQRETTMDQFRAGNTQALIATTVIEVGVDVPNASIIVIEHAEQFGLAQLHQLRGRVGRGNRKSLCTLIAEPTTDDARARLDAIASTTDGFKIAERDLEIRGPGELFGSKQAGAAPFRVARLPDDLKLLKLARRDAKKWIDENPTLSGARDALLRKRVYKAHGEAFGLGDVA